MAYKIELYQIGKRKIVDDFIESLSDKTISKILWMFDLIEKYGLEIGMPYVRKIGNNVFELRIRKQESVRFLFTIKDQTIWILHGFKKKRMKIPSKEINIALNRLTLI